MDKDRMIEILDNFFLGVEKLLKLFLIGVFIYIVAIVIIGLYGCKTTGSIKANKYSMPSPVNARKIVYYDKRAKVKKYSLPSPINNRKTVYYNKKGKVKGYSMRSPIDSRKTVYYKK